MDLSSATNEIDFECITKAGYKFICEDNDYFIDPTQMDNHTVLFSEYSGTGQYLNYVNLPWDSKKHWENVKQSLTALKSRLQVQLDPYLIEIAITKYHHVRQNYKNIEILFKSVSNDWLEKLIPKMVDLVLESPDTIQKQIPILHSNSNQSISISKKQCACILANAFFCTFENRSGNLNHPMMPFFNLNQMLASESYNSTKIEKLKCIMVYFERVTDSEPVGVLTYSRFSVKNLDKNLFQSCTKQIRKSVIMSQGKIEDCTGAVQLDFANKYIGGGVLNSGCVQEEIRFVICPELLVSLLFMERMSENECILIRGAERFADYSGYAKSFKFEKSVIDTTQRDKYERILTDVLAIDAHHFRKKRDQFSEKYFWREIWKSYAGFSASWKTPKDKETMLPCLATGNWGCGVFNGDIQFKYLIQLIAASVADRDLVYFTFGDQDLSYELGAFNDFLTKKPMTVAELVKILSKFGDYRESSHTKVFDFVEKYINDNN